MKVFPTTRDLPNSHLEGIGRICVNWAFLENQLPKITYLLLSVDVKQGHVAVRSPRTAEQIPMIRELMALRNISVESVDLKELASRLVKLEKIRNLFTHGVWLKQEQEFLIQDLAGSWKPDKNGPKFSRRIKPEGILVKEEELNEFVNLIDQVIEAARILEKELATKLSKHAGKSLKR